MSRSWTDEQKQAIGEKNEPLQNILVSAGAGSGKTAVLTERVIRILKDHIDINKLLVLTFTNAAAAEMKERIGKAIKSYPELKEQSDLLDSAYITTFDSYALSLVKKYHYLLGISSNVKIVNDAALKLEKYKIIDEVMEEKYNNKKEEFVTLINKFCLKDDDDFKELIYEINEKFELIIDKDAFIQNYHTYLSDLRINKIWNDYHKLIMEKLAIFRNLYDEIEATLESKEDEVLFEKFQAALEPLIYSDDFDTIASNINYNGRNFTSSKNINETFINNKKKMNELKEEIKSLIELDSKEQIIKSLKENFAFEKEIIDIIDKVNKKVSDLKREKEMFEFMDIAKKAIELLENNESIKEEIKNNIYEIMLDEYQDTSDIQEKLISLISKNNVYMVGDIKQSIYRFRNANPKNFSDKYDNYDDYKKGIVSEKGSLIKLMKNFRSREEVLEDINILFNEIMSEETGINYSKGHKFIHGNKKYNDNIFKEQSNNLEIYNYTREKDSLFSNDEIEAFLIAEDIKNKINNGYMVYDKDNDVQRKLEYGDITILIDRKEPFDTYLKVFQYLGIPMSSYKNNNLTLSDELLCFKNIYKLILNYKNKTFKEEFRHSFMSVARSFLFEYEDNYIFNILKNEDYLNNTIYDSLKEIIEKADYLSISSINDLILEKLDVFYKVSKCKDIEDTMAILHYISDLIKDLNNLGYNLANLVQYFDSVVDKDFKIELPIRKNTMNSVKIMTIHGSKGLEFNICYFAGFNKKFSEFDSKKKFIYDDEYGLILPLFIENEKYTNIAKYLYFKKYYKEEVAEKIRLLYVALSRAKEKMIIVGDFSNKKSQKTKIQDCRSFYDLIKYAENTLSNYFVNIDLENYNITNAYKFANSIKALKNESSLTITNKEISIYNEIIEQTSFSKKQNELITEEIVNILNKGTKLHHILETMNFNRNELNNYLLTKDEKNILENFLNSELLKDINKGKIYKEYEFIYLDNNEEKHGIIDLMIAYDNHIDIIDYKLSNIDDKAYINQLNGYKNYIENISNKKVNLYLYSLLKNKYKQI